MEIPENPELGPPWERLVEAFERGIEAIVGEAGRLGEALIAEGREALEARLGDAMERIEETGIIHSLGEAGTRLAEACESLRDVGRALAELPAEELRGLVALVVIAAFAPEVLLQNPELVGRLCNLEQ